MRAAAAEATAASSSVHNLLLQLHSFKSQLVCCNSSPSGLRSPDFSVSAVHVNVCVPPSPALLL